MEAFSSNDQRRVYRELAWVWPIISPPEAQVAEAENLWQVIRTHAAIEVKTLLDLGCGGGHNDYTLKQHVEVTGLDVSEAMLALARRLNPNVAYHVGDMRTVRLGQRFDAVVVADSIYYMATEEDLRATFVTAFHHLKPGGTFCTYAGLTADRFQQNLTRCSTHAEGDVEISFVENLYDPDPTDTSFEATYVYLIRRGGQLQIETDRHRCGLFTVETWLALLKQAGFETLGFKGEGYPILVGRAPR